MKNDATLSKGKSTASCNAQNTNLHKLQAMGHPAKFEVSGGKKTPA